MKKLATWTLLVLVGAMVVTHSTSGYATMGDRAQMARHILPGESANACVACDSPQNLGRYMSLVGQGKREVAQMMASGQCVWLKAGQPLQVMQVSLDRGWSQVQTGDQAATWFMPSQAIRD